MEPSLDEYSVNEEIERNVSARAPPTLEEDGVSARAPLTLEEDGMLAEGMWRADSIEWRGKPT